MPRVSPIVVQLSWPAGGKTKGVSIWSGRKKRRKKKGEKERDRTYISPAGDKVIGFIFNRFHQNCQTSNHLGHVREMVDYDGAIFERNEPGAVNCNLVVVVSFGEDNTPDEVSLVSFLSLLVATTKYSLGHVE